MRAFSPNGTAQSRAKVGILAPHVVRSGVAHLDRSAGHRVGSLQAGHDLAGRKDLNLELVVGRFGDDFGEMFGRAVQSVERLGPTCGQPPFDLRRGLGDGRSSDRCSGTAPAAPAPLMKLRRVNACHVGVSPHFRALPRVVVGHPGLVHRFGLDSPITRQGLRCSILDPCEPRQPLVAYWWSRLPVIIRRRRQVPKMSCVQPHLGRFVRLRTVDYTGCPCLAAP